MKITEIIDSIITKVNSKVNKTGDQTKSGILTFVDSPIVPTPTTNTQAANKGYVDTKQANLGFVPVQQGTGIGQFGNAVKIGWSIAERVKITIDASDLGNIVMDNNIGFANSPLVKTALNASGGAPIYACRAWVNFNGTGTVAIRASGNVSSITDNAVGNFIVNFATAMVDANYSASCMGENTTDLGCIIWKNRTIPMSTSQYPIVTLQVPTLILFDPANVQVSIFR